MSPRTFLLPGTATLIKLAVLVAALLGLFVMHGLAAHGTAYAPSPGGLAVGGANVGDPFAVHDPPSHHRSEGGTGGVGGSGGQDPQDGSEASLLGLCLAVLAAAVIGVVGLCRRRARTRLRLGSAAVVGAFPPPAASRDRDPPFLHALSIQRC